MALVALTGTEKQIVWAEQIRAKAVTQAQAVLDNPVWEKSWTQSYRKVAEMAFKLLVTQEKASWWIDHQGTHGALLMTHFAAVARDYWKKQGKGDMFKHPNQFMTGDRTPLLVDGAHIY